MRRYLDSISCKAPKATSSVTLMGEPCEACLPTVVGTREEPFDEQHDTHEILASIERESSDVDLEILSEIIDD
jgi:hypothetical protein